MAVCCLYLVKSDLSSEHVYTVAYTGQVTFYKVLEKHDHVKKNY